MKNMKKLMVSIIVIGCLLASSIVSANALLIKQKNKEYSNERIPIIKNIFDKNECLNFMRKGDIQYPLEPLSTDLDGNIAPAYFNTWCDAQYDSCTGIGSTFHDGYFYQSVDVFKNYDNWIGILKYSALDGTLCDYEIWTDEPADCLNIAILDDCLYVCGIPYYNDYPVLLKYDISGGDINFEKSLIVPYYRLVMRMICADDDNIYICGDNTSNNVLFLQKYNTDLEPIWSEPKIWDGPYFDECYGMTFYEGSIFLTGSTTYNHDGYNSFVLKFDTDGNLLEEIIGLNDNQIGVAVKGYGEKIYVVYNYAGGLIVPDIDSLVAAYDTNLVNLWTSERYDYCNYDQISDIVLVDDYIYMSGIIWGIDWESGSADFCNGFILKADINNGEKIWWKVVDDTLWTQAYGISADDSYLYLSGTNSFDYSEESFILKCDFNGNPNSDSPNVPTITGETKGGAGVEYDYTLVSTMNSNDVDLKYFIDWGDGSTNTTDFYPSGQEIVVSHTWAEKGSYTIRAKATTIYGYESGWGTLSVKMPLDLPGSQHSSPTPQSQPNLYFLIRTVKQFL